jgi:toxin ParE1/3/4
MSRRKRRIILSPPASDDLDDILLYTEQQWGERQKASYRKALFDGLNRLTSYPDLGKARPNYGSDARGLQIEHHVAICRATDTEVIIARLLHKNRDIDSDDWQAD